MLMHTSQPDQESPIEVKNRSDKIFYYDGEQRIPFRTFLRNAIEQSDSSWDEISTKCGFKLSAYAPLKRDARIVTPPYERFQIIIAVLGYEESDFEISENIHTGPNKVPERGSKEYNAMLSKIGDAILKK